jgi:hypothetical protein
MPVARFTLHLQFDGSTEWGPVWLDRREHCYCLVPRDWAVQGALTAVAIERLRDWLWTEVLGPDWREQQTVSWRVGEESELVSAAAVGEALGQDVKPSAHQAVRFFEVTSTGLRELQSSAAFVARVREGHEAGSAEPSAAADPAGM